MAKIWIFYYLSTQWFHKICFVRKPYNLTCTGLNKQIINLTKKSSSNFHIYPDPLFCNPKYLFCNSFCWFCINWYSWAIKLFNLFWLILSDYQKYSKMKQPKIFLQEIHETAIHTKDFFLPGVDFWFIGNWAQFLTPYFFLPFWG
jgi:hypothetical protein